MLLRDSVLGKEMLFGSAKYIVSWFLQTKWKNNPFREELFPVESESESENQLIFDGLFCFLSDYALSDC